MTNFKSDAVQRFLFEHADIRGEIICLENSLQEILSQRSYPMEVQSLLAEALMSAVLLASSFQFEGSLSLQFHGDKRLPLMLVQCDHELHVRALVKFDDSIQDDGYNSAFLEGRMSLFINQYDQTEAYQSIVPIQSLSMADNLAHYFAQSDQIATQVRFVISDKKAAGILLQQMPGQRDAEREEFWNYALKMAETLSEDELLNLDNPTLLHRLYHETELRLFPARQVSFRCRCTVDKMKQVLSTLGREELEQLLKDQEGITVDCDFCNQSYQFDSIDIEVIYRSVAATDIWVKPLDEPPSDTSS